MHVPRDRPVWGGTKERDRGHKAGVGGLDSQLECMQPWKLGHSLQSWIVNWVVAYHWTSRQAQPIWVAVVSRVGGSLLQAINMGEREKARVDICRHCQHLVPRKACHPSESEL